LHEFEADGASTLMRDVVEYRLPFGALGELMHRLWVERTLKHIFDHRRRRTQELLGRGPSPGETRGRATAAAAPPAAVPALSDR
jgi:hypothetical protein